MKARSIVLTIVCFLMLMSAVFSDVPRIVNYQGRLVDSTGKVVSDGNYTVTFSLYDAATGGTAVWAETQTVTTKSGLFSVLLGTVSAFPSTLTFNQDYYLGIKVGSDAEMTPRQRLSANFFAINSAMLEGKTTSDFAASTHTHTITTNEITDGTIADADVSSSAAISASKISTSGAANMVTKIIAGSNVTISPSTGVGDVTINASASGSSGGTVTQITTGTGLTGGPITTTGTISVATGGITSALIADGTITDLDVDTTKIQKRVTGSCAGQVVAAINADGTVTCEADDTGAGGSFVNLQTTTPGTQQTGNLNISGTAVVGSVSGSSTNATDSAGTFVINNASNATAAVQGSTNGSGIGVYGQSNGGSSAIAMKAISYGSGAAGYFLVDNAANANAALGAETNGTGKAASFEINLTTNSNPIIYGDTAGSGNLLQLTKNAVDKFVVDNTGNLFVGNPTTTAAKVSAEETATTNNAAVFKISNASNSNYAVWGETDGTGEAGHFEINNASNSSAALSVGTDGTGIAGFLGINNASNSASVLVGNTIGTGNLLQLQKSGVDKFVVDNAGNITVGGATDPGAVKLSPASAQTIQPTADVVPLIIKDDAGTTANLLDVQNSSGTSLVKVNPSGNLLVGEPISTNAKISVLQTSAGMEAGGLFKIDNPLNTLDAVGGITNGLAGAAFFQSDNVSNSQAVVFAAAAGSGPLYKGNTSGTGNLLQLQKSGVDKFVVDNAGNITVGGSSDPGAVKLSPTAAQTIQPTADVVPLIIKDDAVGTTANLFDVQDNAGTSLVRVKPSGDLFVGNPVNGAKVSAMETGTTDGGGNFEINNASNPFPAVYGVTTGTGMAGQFQISNAGNASNAVYGFTNGLGYAGYFSMNNISNSNPAVYASSGGTGPAVYAYMPGTGSVFKGNTISAGNLLLQLQQNSVDKFLVNNDGSIRIVTPKTPTGTADASGSIGDVAWDDNYIYVKTSAGWKRTALSAW